MLPFTNLYAASKTFVNYFSRMLNLESSSVQHQLIIHNFVATKMSGVRPSFFVPSAEAYAKSAVNLIGLVEESAGYWNHELCNAILLAIPQWLLKFVFKRMAKKGASKKDK